jgi:hypothetical protein
MPDREKYRRKAYDCVAAAEHIRDPQERAAMLAIAQAFMRMADRVGARHERATAHRATDDQHPANDS